MPAAVETMAYMGATPWHGIGTEITREAAKDWRLVMQSAGLDWTVDRRPIFLSDLATSDGPLPSPVLGSRIDSHFANVRTSDNKVLGVVGKDFRILQNQEAFEWLQPLLESGDIVIETAGALFGGRRIWALARIEGARDAVRDQDPVQRYILIAHAHDGTLCVWLGITDVRVVCNNTLTAALGDESAQHIRLRHTSNLIKNMDAVRKAIDLTRKGFFATLDTYRKLADKGINQADVRRYVQIVFDVKAEDLRLDKDEPANKRVAERVDHIISLAYTGKGNSGTSVWDAYNAVTEYTSWERGRTQDTRLNSVWFGESAKLNRKALETAIEFAG